MTIATGSNVIKFFGIIHAIIGIFPKDFYKEYAGSGINYV
jgi:hypothetical protein